jgi:hypothetical protein
MKPVPVTRAADASRQPTEKPPERAVLRPTAQITNRDREYMSYSIVPALIQDDIGGRI